MARQIPIGNCETLWIALFDDQWHYHILQFKDLSPKSPIYFLHFLKGNKKQQILKSIQDQQWLYRSNEKVSA